MVEDSAEIVPDDVITRGEAVELINMGSKAIQIGRNYRAVTKSRLSGWVGVPFY